MRIPPVRRPATVARALRRWVAAGSHWAVLSAFACDPKPPEPHELARVHEPGLSRPGRGNAPCPSGASAACGTWVAQLVLKPGKLPLERDWEERRAASAREKSVVTEGEGVAGSLSVIVDKQGQAVGQLRGGLEAPVRGAVTQDEIRLSIESNQLGGFLVAHKESWGWQGTLRCARHDQSAVWSAAVQLRLQDTQAKALQ